MAPGYNFDPPFPWAPRLAPRPRHYQLLNIFMPKFAHIMTRQRLSQEATIRHLVRDSSRRINRTALCKAYRAVLRILLTAYDAHSVYTQIRNKLEYNIRADQRRILQRRQAGHERTLNNFELLSEITRQTQGYPIGSILSGVFLTYGRSLLSDGIQAVGELAHSLFRSKMSQNDKTACLRLIARQRPDMVNFLWRYSDSETRQLRNALRRLIHAEHPRNPMRGGVRRNMSPPTRRPSRNRLRNMGGGGRRDMSPTPRRPSCNRPRNRSDPGFRRLARQVDRVADAAEKMASETDELRKIAGVY